MMWNKNCDGTKKSGKYCHPPPFQKKKNPNKQRKEMPYIQCITNSRSINNLQTAEFFTFEIAKLLAGVAHNMLYLFPRACSRFSIVKRYVDWRCVY